MMPQRPRRSPPRTPLPSGEKGRKGQRENASNYKLNIAPGIIRHIPREIRGKSEKVGVEKVEKVGTASTYLAGRSADHSR
jgi:hypothetical protein